MIDWFIVSYDSANKQQESRAYARGEGLGFDPPLEFDILQKRYYLRKGVLLFTC